MAVETITIKDADGVERQVSADQIGNAFAQVFKLAWGTDGTLTLVDGTNPLPVDPAAGGTWGYKAGTTGTPTLTGKRVVSISCLAGDSGATITINGGDTISVPANTSFGVPINGRLTAPAIVFTGTATYFVETST